VRGMTEAMRQLHGRRQRGRRCLSHSQGLQRVWACGEHAGAHAVREAAALASWGCQGGRFGDAIGGGELGPSDHALAQIA
jgi:hypothetical protein